MRSTQRFQEEMWRNFNQPKPRKKKKATNKMNKRVRELAEQAGIEFDDDFPLEPETIYYLKLSDFKKFAELIVRECVKVCKSRVGNSDYNTGRMHCASDLKEHFGVEQ